MEQGLDITAMSFEQALASLKRALQARYPECGLVYFTYSPGKESDMYSYGMFGELKKIDMAGTEVVQRDSKAYEFIHDVFCNSILTLDKDSKLMQPRVMKEIHDLLVDYAAFRGIDTTGLEYFLRDTKKNNDKVGQCTVDSIAARIRMLNEEKYSLMRSLNPQNKLAVLKALEKRLRKAGDLSGADKAAKEAADIQKKIDNAIQAKPKRIAALAKARAVKADKKRNKEQAEKDRQKSQQFDPHKAAKAKAKKIRERQQERAASKKKGQEGRDYANIPIHESISRVINR